MKKRSTILIAFMALIFSATAQTITIDGNFANWNDVPYAYENAEGTAGNLLAIKVFSSPTHINFLLEGSPTMVLDVLQIFLDTDNNPATGYSSHYVGGSSADLNYREVRNGDGVIWLNYLLNG